MNKTDEKWFIERRNQRIEGGGKCETTETVRVLSRDGTKRIIEAIVLTDKDTDRSGNISVNRGKGYHYIALMDGKKQLSFAIDFTKSSLGWRVLSNNGTSFVQDVKSKKAAIELLTIASTQNNARTDERAWRLEAVAEAADKRDAEKQAAEADQ